MITNIRICNFKGLKDAEFALGESPIVLVGPNNCGKTSILQALTMWHVGASEWIEQYSSKKKATSMRGVSIPSAHFLALPPTNPNRIWHEGKHSIQRAKKKIPILIQIGVSGKSNGASWDIGVEFYSPKPKEVICRPIHDDLVLKDFVLDGSLGEVAARWRKILPQVEFIPPMSGMSWEEDKLTTGSILSRLGEGRTAEVLRNLLYQTLQPEGAFCQTRGPGGLVAVTPEQAERRWEEIKECIQKKFHVELARPFLDHRGKVHADYRQNGKEYNLAFGGRGFHQTLLMLALMHLRPGNVLVLDEPDAHLEGVRQRDNFSMYSEIAQKHNSQLIIASHSEVVMNQAAPEGIVSVIDGKAANLNASQIGQFKKLLTGIGWEKVIQAKTKGHVVFLEGATDIEFLAAFAEKLFGAMAAEKIRLANVEYVGNVVKQARELFHALHSGVPELRGRALFDKDILPRVQGGGGQNRPDRLNMECWQRREIENYLLLPDVLRRFAQNKGGDPRLMDAAIERLTPPVALEKPAYHFWRKESMKKYIAEVFAEFRKRAGGEHWNDSRCHTLVQYMEPDEIPDEVRKKITRLLAVIDPDFNPE